VGGLNGEQIRLLRESKGWDQRRLAQAAGVNPSVISRLERGLQKDVMLSVTLAIAAALGVPLSTMVDEPGKAPTQELIPELRAIVVLLAGQSEAVQKQVAGMIRGFLGAIAE
jgi:transcriptional regulator with XRE-family HTH domain